MVIILNGDNNGKRIAPKIRYAVIAGTAFIALMVIIMSIRNNTFLNMSFTEDVNIDTQPKTFGNFIVENERIYNMYVSINDKTNTVKTGLKFENQDGEVIWSPGKGAVFFANKPVLLQAGEYSVTFIFDSQSKEDTPVDINFKID